MNQYIKDYGHCCSACKHYNLVTGYCNKTKEYHYGYDFTYGDGKCPNWIIAEDLIEHRPKKQIKIEKVKLL